MFNYVVPETEKRITQQNSLNKIVKLETRESDIYDDLDLARPK